MRRYTLRGAWIEIYCNTWIEIYCNRLNLHSCALRGAWIEIYIAHVKRNRPAPTPQKVNWGGASFTLRHEFLAVLSLSFFPSSFPIVSVSSGLCAEAGKGIISLFLHYFSLTTCAYPPRLPATRTRVAGGARTSPFLNWISGKKSR